MKSTTIPANEHALQRAADVALASLLNLTLLPIISFIFLLVTYKKTAPNSIDRYHTVLGIKLNSIAAVVLLVVSGLMIFLGGFDSPWTWVYVISYFTMVHTLFIIIAIWALVRAWSGEKLRR
jgi:protein-S-isoprenylcysteine O-methyltransferase Ste14